MPHFSSSQWRKADGFKGFQRQNFTQKTMKHSFWSLSVTCPWPFVELDHANMRKMGNEMHILRVMLLLWSNGMVHTMMYKKWYT